MEDKEVGKLWARTTPNTANPLGMDKKIRDLIWKLVEERALYKYADHGPKNLSWEEVAASYRWNAMQDFGIDPKTLLT